jgi:hypothetical protein
MFFECAFNSASPTICTSSNIFSCMYDVTFVCKGIGEAISTPRVAAV